MGIQRNIKTRSYNHYGRGKAVSIIYSECMSVALSIQHAMRMCHIIVCGVSGSIIPFHNIAQTAQLLKRKVIEYKMCVSIICTTFVWNSPHFKEKWVRYKRNCTSVLMQSTRHSCPILIKVEFSRQSFETFNIKFRGNPTSGNRVFPRRQADRQKDMTKLMVAFSNFSNP